MSDGMLWTRRQCLRALGLSVAGPLAGCSTAVGDSAGPDATNGPACANDVEVTEQSARVELGQVPEVEVRVRNTGSVTLDYELVVVFEQGTSLGIDARTGRDMLTGTLEPDEAVVETATDDASDVRNTDHYELSLSVTCRS